MMAQSILWREPNRVGIAKCVEPKDVMQGHLGNCTFLSTIASIASYFP
jgi:hypothetical protein